ncbi:unnamed protein product [Pseudo-nitzschia multistriata]|uniref:Uncharacterized protein n=1 Tax=Pseudo-nitzschia multistriata TaxID=183589 RepID=A0A448Z5Y6_9STRA|nr:unnamed protein product [Pseudo-nitzschia multistriata]
MQQLIRSWRYCWILLLPAAHPWTSDRTFTRCIQKDNNLRPSLLHSKLPASVGRRKRIISFASEGDFVDVEFERSPPEMEEESTEVIVPSEEDNNENDLSALLGTSKNLLEVSLETGDPRWKEIRIPFFRGTEYIDCKLTFMVDLEGQSYGIGIPFDDVVAIVIQEDSEKKKQSEKNKVTETKNISPDDYEHNEEYAELMEIFAGQVQEQLGEQFQLRKTPKVLTISGGLDKVTKDWQNRVITKPFEVEDLLEMSKEKNKEEVNDELDSFFKFMKDELGEEEFEKTMNCDGDDYTLEEELKELEEFFSVPGADGTFEGGTKGLDELMKGIENDVKAGEVKEANEFIPDTENAALKLLGYTFKDSGKSYFLVKPLQPYTLVGRHAKDEEDMIRFDLLSPEEEKLIIPKLESMCQEDLKANGLNLDSSNVNGYQTP